MKTLTILQPWASLWAANIKQNETRSWPTAYRGPLAIHAGRGRTAPGREIWELLWDPDAFEGDLPARLTAAGLPRDFDALPFGKIIATTHLTGCHRTETIPKNTPDLLLEHFLGDFSPDRFAWQRGPVTPLACPIPATGKLGLWNCPLL